MTQLSALVRKEARELRWFLVGGLVVFSGVPLTVRLYCNVYPTMFSDLLWMLILWLGGLMAVCIAVGATCRDMADDLRTFWQSRPISPLLMLSVKYLVGLLVLLIVTCTPLISQVLMHLPESPRTWEGEMWGWDYRYSFAMLTSHTFILVACYSVAFLIGCLVRRAAQAALLSLAAGLVLYFVPALLPPLNFMDVFYVMQTANPMFHWLLEYLLFTGGFIAFSVIAAVLAWAAVSRDWRLHIGTKVMCWTLVGVVFLMLGVNALQLGSNMQLERRIHVQPDEVVKILASGNDGVLLLESWGAEKPGQFGLRRLDLAAEGAEIGPEVTISTDRGKPLVAWSADHPDRAYCVVQRWGRREDGIPVTTGTDLLTVAFDAPGGPSVIHRLDLLERVPEMRNNRWLSMYLHGRSIYLLAWSNLATIDIANPDAPLFAGVTTLEPGMIDDMGHQRDARTLPGTITFELLPIPSLQEGERLEVSFNLFHWYRSWESVSLDGDVLATIGVAGLSVYGLEGFAGRENTARFRYVGRRQPTPLEKLDALARSHYSPIAVDEGFAYVQPPGNSSSVVVYDLEDLENPRRVAYYYWAQDYIRDLVPLSKGRLLLIGREYLEVVKLRSAD